MSPLTAASIILALLPLTTWAQTTASSQPGGVLSQFTVSSFVGTGTVNINTMTTDAAGNVYIAGMTSAPDLKMTNPAQPAIRDGLIYKSLDRGSTWQKLANPLASAPSSIAPDPTNPQILFAVGAAGIDKTLD